MDIQLTKESFNPAVKTVGVQVLTRPSLSYWQDAWLRLKMNKQSYKIIFDKQLLLDNLINKKVKVELRINNTDYINCIFELKHLFNLHFSRRLLNFTS